MRIDVRTTSRVFLCLAALAGSTAPCRPVDGEPLDLSQEESVATRLVTVDVLVIDSDGRSVPGLEVEDFVLRVDGKPTPIDTLDVACVAGAADDPTSSRIGRWDEPPPAGDEPRRIVLAIDYMHLPILPCSMFDSSPCRVHTLVLDMLQEMMRREFRADDEIMVVALDGGLRIEQPFTTDREMVRRTLRRMEYDVSLWNGSFFHLTELPLLQGLDALVEVLDSVPGTKAVVLFSGGVREDDINEPEFARIATLASAARVAFYPVDCMGLHREASAFT